MNLLSILLQTPAGGSQWSGILMMVVIVAIFYFFMIRPQQKKQKEIQKSREALPWKQGICCFSTVVPRHHASALIFRICLENQPTRLNRDNRRPANIAFSVPPSQ